MFIQNFCGPNALVYLQVAVVSPVLRLYVSVSGMNFYLPQMIYLYHSNSLSSLNFLLLTANFQAQENSVLSCIFFFLDISSNYFPSALIFLKLNEGRWCLHLPVLEGVSNPLISTGRWNWEYKGSQALEWEPWSVLLSRQVNATLDCS